MTELFGTVVSLEDTSSNHSTHDCGLDDYGCIGDCSDNPGCTCDQYSTGD